MMKKRLTKMMYILMTSVLIFSMVATNIVLVTADTKKATFEDLQELYNEYAGYTDAGDAFLEAAMGTNDKVDFKNVISTLGSFSADSENEAENERNIKNHYNDLVHFTEQIDAYVEVQKEQETLKNQLIEAMNALHSLVHNDGNLHENNYLSAGWDTFSLALERAEETLNDAKALLESKEEIHTSNIDDVEAAYNALDEAIQDLKKKADVSALDAQYHTYKEIDNKGKGNYTNKSWDAFIQEMDDVKNLLNDESAIESISQQEVDDMLANLQAVVNALDVKGDISALVDLSNDYTKYVEEMYTRSTWEKFETALDKAQEMIDNFDENDTGQEKINELYQSLQTAEEQLRKKGSKNNLEKQYITYIDSRFVDEEETLEKYTRNSWKTFEKTLDKVAAFLEDEEALNDASQDDMNAWLRTLNDARAVLKERGDLGPLTKRFDAASEFVADNYTQRSWRAFSDIYAKIEHFLTDDSEDAERHNALRNDIDIKLSVLNQAIAELVEKGDTASLQDAYNRYVQYEESDYTAASWKPFAEILEDIRKFLEGEAADPNLTQDQVKKKVAELTKAHHELVKKGDPTKLRDLYEQYVKEEASDYTTSSWKAFAEVLKEMDLFLNSEIVLNEKTQEGVDAELKRLQTAIKSLEKRGDTTALKALYERYANSIESIDDEADEPIKQDNYTTSTWAVFVAEVERINKEFLSDDELLANSTQKEVNEQLKDLEAAFNQLENRGDMHELKNVYEDHLGLLDDEENYTRSSWAEVKSALEEALETTATYLDNAEDADVAADISQREIDEEKAKLYDLSDKLVLRGNIDSLAAAYEERKQELEEEGKTEKYTTKSLNALEDELTRIAAFLADEELLADARQEDVDAEQNNLEAVKLEERGQIKALQKVYDKAAKELDKNANTYRISAVKSLQAALEEAFTKYIEGNDKYVDASQKELDDATNDIEGLHEALKSEANKRGDASILEKAYAKTSAKKLDIYTKNTKENLEALLKEIGQFLTDGSKDDARQEELNTMLEELAKVEGQLVRKGEISLVQNAYNKYNAYKAEDYNPGSWRIFRNKMDEVEKFLADPDARENADNDKVAKMRELMEEAVAQLEKQPVDFTELDEAFRNFTNEFSHDDIKRYAKSDKEAERMIKTLNKIDDYFNEPDKATNHQTNKYVTYLEDLLDEIEAGKASFEESFGELEELIEKLADFTEEGIRKYITDEETANEIINVLAEIEDYLDNESDATNQKNKENVEILQSIYQELTEAKEAVDKKAKEEKDFADLQKEYKNIRDTFTEEDIKNYGKENADQILADLKEIEAYFKRDMADMTPEETEKHLKRLSEIQEELNKAKADGNKPGDDNTTADGNKPGDGTQSAYDNKPGVQAHSGDGNKLGDGTQSGAGTTLSAGTLGDGETPTLRDEVDQITTDPIGTVKDARDKYVLPHTASDNYKYIVTGILMIVEGLFLYGYFRFFSFLRTRFDLF